MATKSRFDQDTEDIEVFINTFNSRISDFERNVLISVGQVEGEPTNIAFINSIVDDSLRRSGYFEVLDEMINENYQKILNQERGFIEDAVGEAVQLSEDTLSGLMSQKGVDLQNFGEMSNNIKNKISNELYQFNQGSVTRLQLQQRLKAIIGQYSNWTSVQVDAAIAGFKQRSSVEMALVHGIEEFKYIGVLDQITRPFCRQVLTGGHGSIIKTIAQWNALNDDPKRKGQPDPVSVFRGGYRCRHRLVAHVSEDGN